jgi:hypothetical protein
MRLADRLEHDERLEALLAQLHGRPGAEVDAGALEDVSNIARRRCASSGAHDPFSVSRLPARMLCGWIHAPPANTAANRGSTGDHHTVIIRSLAPR